MKMRHPKTEGVAEVTEDQFEVWRERGWEKAPDDAETTAEKLDREGRDAAYPDAETTRLERTAVTEPPAAPNPSPVGGSKERDR